MASPSLPEPRSQCKLHSNKFKEDKSVAHQRRVFVSFDFKANNHIVADGRSVLTLGRKAMRAVLEFYQPYVSNGMPKRWHMEILFPIACAVLLAVGASAPLLYYKHWLYTLLSICLCFCLLYTLQAAFHWTHAVRQPDGSLYISPSVDSSIRGGIFMFSIGFSALYLMGMASLMQK